jgi:hypothetical protein
MLEQDASRKQKIASILNIIAGIFFLGAGFNILGASPSPTWMWLVLAVLFILAGIWGLLR